MSDILYRMAIDMKTLYLDCSAGAAGDMLSAALLELTDDKEKVLAKLNSLGIGNVHFTAEKSVKCGICGTHMSVKINGEEESEAAHNHAGHGHSDMSDIENITAGLSVSEKVKADILAVYEIIAKAESKVHGVPVSQIHFHEVGQLDAVADITAVCMLMEKIAADKIICSPVHAGSGSLRCAHGILPVPAPATAEILKGIPFYGGEIKGELCTPTGAALLRYFADEFGGMPVMKTEKIGYGMGKKDFEIANCVRAFLGENESKTESVWELSCNIDDMTAEQLAFASEKMLKEGALDCFSVPALMKKGRQGTLFCVLCKEENKAHLIKQIFKHTTTIGIREAEKKRYVLSRRTEEVNTPFGIVRRKISSGYGTQKSKYEYDDLAKIAEENNLSIAEVTQKIEN